VSCSQRCLCARVLGVCRREGAELIDDTFLRDVILNFIIAGRDTTANALSWCIYTICSHPAVEAKVGRQQHVHPLLPCAVCVHA
jgi:cytochrome P450